ncbi:hypothetical protein CSKR_105670 [Clonorchis sinensis]|uniref:Uncharacterized protein n=1 Tax=Clonorchis sinensis TaxID=79923 RepID=A0A3R7CLK9_CLOSI|nr:hypothetical protein CSKR_105670 [Clonorchis sinensis]
MARVTKSVSGDDEVEGLAKRINGHRNLRNTDWAGGYGRELGGNSCGCVIKVGVAAPCHPWPNVLRFSDSPVTDVTFKRTSLESSGLRCTCSGLATQKLLKMRNKTTDLVKQRSWRDPAGQFELRHKTTNEASWPWTVRPRARVTKLKWR